MSAGVADSAARRSSLTVVAAAGVAVTVTIGVARMLPGLGDSRHNLAVLTIDDLHEGQLEIAAAMVLTLVSAVLWGRVRRAPSRRHLLLFTSFWVLAVDNLVSALFTASFDSLSDSQFASWATTGTGLLGAALLMLAAWLPDEPLAQGRHSVLTTTVLAGCAVAAVVGAAWVLGDKLPDALESIPVRALELEFLSAHPVLVAMEAATAVYWAVAAVLFTHATARTGDDLTGLLGVAGVLAALASLNYALLPSHLIELMYLGDYFFLAAVCLLLVAAVREVGTAEAALVDRAVYTERRRIAREMHDGVTQELAYIASQAHAAESDPTRSSRALRRIRDAVERALDQTRTAIAELSGPVDESLAASIATTAHVVSRRTGARLELTLDESLVVSDDVRLALVQATREALNHAARHGAPTVRIDLRRNGALGLRVTIDGPTADVDEADRDVELASIRDRIAGVDGEVTLHPRPNGGATLEVLVP